VRGSLLDLQCGTKFLYCVDGIKSITPAFTHYMVGG
jgi:hypothetical protein